MTSMDTVMVGKEKMEKVKAEVIGVRAKEKLIVILLMNAVNMTLLRIVKKIMERATMEKGKENIPPMEKASHLMDEARANAQVKMTLEKKTQTSMRVMITLKKATMAGRMWTAMKRSLKTELLLKTHRRAKRRKRKAKFA